MDPTLLGSLATASGTVAAAVLVWLGKRGTARQSFEKSAAERAAELTQQTLDRQIGEIERKDTKIDQLNAKIDQLEHELEYAHDRNRELGGP